MAFRRPLYYTGGNLRQMSDSQIEDVRTRMFWLYIANPVTTLSVVSSGGNLGLVQYDWRLKAGAAAYSATNYPTAPDATYENDAYYTLSQTVQTESAPTNPNNVGFPMYYDGTNLRAMSLQDIYDTFAFDTINNLVGSNEIYRVAQTTSLSGYTRLSGTVHIDNRADIGAYSASSIPEATDQFVEVSRTYLFKRNSQSTSYQIPTKATSSGEIQTYSQSNFDSLLENSIRYVAYARSGYKIRYGIDLNAFNETRSFSGNSCGGITDSGYGPNSTGTQYNRFVNIDDYRSQKFPSGSLVSYTSYLKVRTE
jgi:hypothetical protein